MTARKRSQTLTVVKSGIGLSALEQLPDGTFRTVPSQTLITSRYARVMLAGAGFLADAYDLFVINLVLRLLKDEYPEYAASGNLQMYEGFVASAALFGAIVGQLVAGSMADVIGRKKIFVVTALLITIGSLGSATGGDWPGFSVYGQISVWRILLGLGVGGEYPLAATVTSESSSASRRGTLMASVFAMQGVGALLSVGVVIVCLSLDCSAGFTWRFALAFGAVPAMLAFPWRLRMHETESFQRVKNNRKFEQEEERICREMSASAGLDGVGSVGSLGSIGYAPYGVPEPVVITPTLHPSGRKHAARKQAVAAAASAAFAADHYTDKGASAAGGGSGCGALAGGAREKGLQPHHHVSTHTKSGFLSLERVEENQTFTDQSEKQFTSSNRDDNNNNYSNSNNNNSNNSYGALAADDRLFPPYEQGLVDYSRGEDGSYSSMDNVSTGQTRKTTHLNSTAGGWRGNTAPADEESSNRGGDDSSVNSHNNSTVCHNSSNSGGGHSGRVGELAHAFKYYKWHIFGTALCWFLLDVDFYANGLFNHDVTSMVLAKGAGGKTTAFIDAINAGILSAIGLPGYILSTIYIEKVGRKNLQMLGFGIMAVLFFICSCMYDWLLDPEGGAERKYIFLVIYALTFLFSNFGPNTTSFVIPGEIYPATVRATCHGISAASGKLGAATGAYFFPFILGSHSSASEAASSPAGSPTHIGLRHALLVCSVIALLGVLVTYLFIPEYDGAMLEDEDNYLELSHSCLQPSNIDRLMLERERQQRKMADGVGVQMVQVIDSSHNYSMDNLALDDRNREWGGDNKRGLLAASGREDTPLLLHTQTPQQDHSPHPLLSSLRSMR